MANTLTNLIPTLYEAVDIVSRELVGFIPAVNRNSSAERAAKGQQVLVPVTGVEEASDIVPGQAAPDEGDTSVGSRPVTISKSRKVPVRFNGEETQGLRTAGTYNTILRDRFAQGMRTLTNEIEADLAALAAAASRAYGVAGTAPFGTANDLSDFAGAAQILDDNGAPIDGRQLVIDSVAMANLRGKQALLNRVNEAGTDTFLREGYIPQGVHGLAVRYSGQVARHTAGTGADHLVNKAGGLEAGDTVIPVDGGTGTIVAGDVVTFAGHDAKYVVAAALADGSFSIAAPGLQAAVADNAAVTVVASHTANVVLHRNAVQLVTRAPALPEGGDNADDRITVTDPVSGLAFEIAMYRQYRQLYMEVAMAWGCAATKPEHIGKLLG